MPDESGVSSRHCHITAEVNLSGFFSSHNRLRYLADNHHWDTILLKVRYTLPFPLLPELTSTAKSGFLLHWHISRKSALISPSAHPSQTQIAATDVSCHINLACQKATRTLGEMSWTSRNQWFWSWLLREANEPGGNAWASEATEECLLRMCD